MPENFPKSEAAVLLAKCHRRCCICHRFCGVKMELDHMLPRADGGTSDIDNAIPVCFECHAEIHGYNDKHPRGRKFRVDELKEHKRQWLEFCEANPGALAQFPPDAGVGPLQALIHEIDFDRHVAAKRGPKELGCALADHQFRRAISSGALGTLDDDVQDAINAAYAAVGRVNHFLEATRHHPCGGNAYNTALNEAQKAMSEVDATMSIAKQKLEHFVGDDAAEHGAAG